LITISLSFLPKTTISNDGGSGVSVLL